MPLVGADVGREIELPSTVAHHALRVLRLGPGDPLTLFTGGGGEFAAVVTHADKRAAWARLETFDPVERETRLAITLAQGLPANDAMDFALRKAVEIGVAAFQPVVTERGARFPADARGEKRIAHWRQIVVAACEQCGRNRLPRVHDVLTLPEWLQQRDRARPGLVLAPHATLSLAQWPGGDVDAADLLIGPEGGLSDDECARAGSAGLTAVRAGPRILRTETAGPAALAALQALWGDWR
jgi:16S rRNA (uracil1498-N3)-methyltransferase